MVGPVVRSDTDAEIGEPGTIDLVLDATPRSISTARHAVLQLLDPLQVPVEVAEDVMLLVSELVTNAVVHAGTAVHVSACAEVGRILVAVGDDDPHHAPRRSERGAMATSGRGMRLVELLASSWGVEMRDSSKSVWFEATYRPSTIDLRSSTG